MCKFYWGGPGNGWVSDPANICPDGGTCGTPTYNGTYIGEPAATDCSAASGSDGRGG